MLKIAASALCGMGHPVNCVSKSGDLKQRVWRLSGAACLGQPCNETNIICQRVSPSARCGIDAPKLLTLVSWLKAVQGLLLYWSGEDLVWTLALPPTMRSLQQRIPSAMPKWYLDFV